MSQTTHMDWWFIPPIYGNIWGWWILLLYQHWPLFPKALSIFGTSPAGWGIFFLSGNALADFEWQILCKDCTSPTAWNSFRSKRGIRRKVGWEVCGSSLRKPRLCQPQVAWYAIILCANHKCNAIWSSDLRITLPIALKTRNVTITYNYPHTHEVDYSSISLW